jgi:N-formylglutamate amidohydrolase
MKAPFCVFHIPHSSEVIPEHVRDTFVLSPQQLWREQLRMMDRYTEELYDFRSDLVERVVFLVSRVVVDPERFLDDAEEPMAVHGQGVVYMLTSEGEPLRHSLSTQARQALIDEFYVPHHRALTQAVDAAQSDWGACLIVDCHSFPSTPSSFEDDQGRNRPDICLGTDPFHTPEWLFDKANDLFSRPRRRIIRNWPYQGALVPLKHYRRSPKIMALMVEVNRSLYMDEESGERLAAFEDICDWVVSTLETLVNYAHKHVTS